MKKIDSFVTRKKFAQIVGMSYESLRNYDKQKIFSPARVGGNGYLYYSIQQIVTINFIRVMTNCHVPIKQIFKTMDLRTPETTLQLLLKSQGKILADMAELNKCLTLINIYSKLIYSGLNADEQGISVEPREPLRVRLGEVNEFQDSFYEPFVKFLQSDGINPAFPVGGYFSSMENFVKNPGMPDKFFSFDPTGSDNIPGGNYMIAYSRGYYGITNGVSEKMRAFARENGLKCRGPVYNLFLLDEVSMTKEDEYLLEARVLVV